jgi:xylulokinase
MADLYLGLDLSTQGLKATAVDSNLVVVFESAVNFDTDLPHYQTNGGAIHHADGLTVTAPTMMWVESLDLLLSRMVDQSFPFSRIVAVSGSGSNNEFTQFLNLVLIKR